MKLIAAIMIVSGHVCPENELQFKQRNESLLAHRFNFVRSDPVNLINPDGSYILYDTVREMFIRAGVAEMGIYKRGKEHQLASMLTTDSNRKRDLYVSYPNPNCAPNNLPAIYKRKGDFSQLGYDTRGIEGDEE